MGLLDATQGDARKWARNRGLELGVATVTDGEGAEALGEGVLDGRQGDGDRKRGVGGSQEVATTPSSQTDEEIARHNETHPP